MGSSRDDSEEQFSLNTDYSPPATCDLGTQQLIARLAAEEEMNDLRADEADDGKKQARKRKLISLKKNLMLKSHLQPNQPSLADKQLMEQPSGSPCYNPLWMVVVARPHGLVVRRMFR
ncbi:hypothetical protein YC2023_000196 [Brassica napus]